MARRSDCRSCQSQMSPKRFSIAWRRSFVDARELLRRYLEQRRELGEKELVLDSLSVDDALRILGAHGSGSPCGESRGDLRAARTDAPVENVGGSDWRAALRAAGAEPTRQSTSGSADRARNDDRAIRGDEGEPRDKEPSRGAS